MLEERSRPIVSRAIGQDGLLGVKCGLKESAVATEEKSLQTKGLACAQGPSDSRAARAWAASCGPVVLGVGEGSEPRPVLTIS